jgi:hypothetical protein
MMNLRLFLALVGLIAIGAGVLIALRAGSLSDAEIPAGMMIVFGLIIARRAILGTAGARSGSRQSASMLVDWARGGNSIMRRCGAVLLIAGMMSLLVGSVLMLLKVQSNWPLITGAASLVGGGLTLGIERFKSR